MLWRFLPDVVEVLSFYSGGFFHLIWSVSGEKRAFRAQNAGREEDDCEQAPESLRGRVLRHSEEGLQDCRREKLREEPPRSDGDGRRQRWHGRPLSALADALADTLARPLGPRDLWRKTGPSPPLPPPRHTLQQACCYSLSKHPGTHPGCIKLYSMYRLLTSRWLTLN